MMYQKLYDIQSSLNELEKDTEGLYLLCEILEEYLYVAECRKEGLVVRIIRTSLERLRKKETEVFNDLDAYILENKNHSCSAHIQKTD